jgi:hypothetical protein
MDGGVTSFSSTKRSAVWFLLYERKPSEKGASLQLGFVIDHARCVAGLDGVPRRGDQKIFVLYKKDGKIHVSGRRGQDIVSILGQSPKPLFRVNESPTEWTTKEVERNYARMRGRFVKSLGSHEKKSGASAASDLQKTHSERQRTVRFNAEIQSRNADLSEKERELALEKKRNQKLKAQLKTAQQRFLSSWCLWL